MALHKDFPTINLIYLIYMIYDSHNDKRHNHAPIRRTVTVGKT